MSKRFGFWALVCAIVIGGASAAFGRRTSPSSEPAALTVGAGTVPASETVDARFGGEALPPGHPPIGPSVAASSLPATNEPAAITWNAPSAWSEVSSASSMRLATYRVPRAAGDDADAELTISRAGGSAEANVERWIGQFDDAGKDERAERTIHGLKITVVEVGGTYVGGGMMPSSGATRHAGFRLLGAVVETRGSSYFFKLTGPSATVRAARASFDALIGGVAPVD